MPNAQTLGRVSSTTNREGRFMEKEISFRSLDGQMLVGTLTLPVRKNRGAVLLVHGLTVDRHEAGFYDLFAARLAANGYASLRFDLRAHGKSSGDFQTFSLSAVLGDIQAAVRALQTRTNLPKCHLVGTSFSGGLTIWASSLIEPKVGRIVLFNPLLNYRKRFLEEKTWFDGLALTSAGVRELSKNGYLKHLSFKLSIPFINELMTYRITKLPKPKIPVLTIHGTQDSMVPYSIAKRHSRYNAASTFLSIGGADHGFYEPSDEDGSDPVTRANWSFVFDKAVEWFRKADRR